MKIGKEKSIPHSHSSILVLLALGIWMMPPADAQAQFHKRGSKGKTTQQPIPSNVDMRTWKYGQMDVRDPAVWGRAIFHPNGNYTESKLDESRRTLVQHTYRAKIRDSDPAVLMQKRLIKLNPDGRPTEVLIYDAAGRLTNRGVLSYDHLGRLTEETLFDTSNNIVRRKIQAYSASGQKMPLRTYNYGKGMADDVNLLITVESVQKVNSAKAKKAKKKSFLRKLQFWKKKDKR